MATNYGQHYEEKKVNKARNTKMINSAYRSQPLLQSVNLYLPQLKKNKLNSEKKRRKACHWCQMERVEICLNNMPKAITI